MYVIWPFPVWINQQKNLEMKMLYIVPYSSVNALLLSDHPFIRVISFGFFYSPVIIKVIKSRRTRWAGQVSWMGETANAYKILIIILDGKITLRRHRRRWVKIRKSIWKWIVYEGVNFIYLLEERTSFEHDNEPWVFIKVVEFLAWLSDYFFLKKDSAWWRWFLT
jgi:hypothetical protein